MSLLAGLTNDSTVANDKDTVGSNFSPLDSNVILVDISLVYINKSKGGATAFNFEGKIVGTDRVYKETLYITNKKGETFYLDKKDQSKQPMPAFVHADNICLLATGKPLSQQTEEKKIVKIYDSEQKKEIPKEVVCITSLHGKQIKLGIIKEKTFKSVLQGNTYVETAETREGNYIDKVFHPRNNKTVAECRAKVEEAGFITEWEKRWVGNINDRVTGKTPKGGNGQGAVAGAPTGAADTSTDMFD